MIEVFVFIWIIGALFTAGLYGTITGLLWIVLAWPYAIGKIVRLRLTGM